MVVWLYGKHGDVRIAPYEPHQRLDQQQRWSMNDDNDEKKDRLNFEL